MVPLTRLASIRRRGRERRLYLVARPDAEASAGRARLEQRGHALSLSLPEGRVCVHGDAVRLEQVISNLLENAIKYTNPGGRLAIALTGLHGI